MRRKNIITLVSVSLFVVVVLILLISIFKTPVNKVYISSEDGDGNRDIPSEADIDSFTFEKTAEIQLTHDGENVYLVNGDVLKVNFDTRNFEATNIPSGKLYFEGKKYIYVKDESLRVNNDGKEELVLSGVNDFQRRGRYIILKTSDSIGYYDIEAPSYTELFKLEEGKTVSVDSVFLLDSGNYYALVDRENATTTIFGRETGEEKTKLDRAAYKGYNHSNFLLLEDSSKENILVVYDFKSDQIVDYKLVGDGVALVTKPELGFNNKLYYYTATDDILSLNFLNLDSVEISNVQLKPQSDYIKTFEKDGYTIIQFASGFYYTKGDDAFKYYEIPFDHISIDNERFYIVKDRELSVIEGTSVTKYSLLGEVVSCLGLNDKFYYTYLTDDAQKLEIIDIKVE